MGSQAEHQEEHQEDSQVLKEAQVQDQPSKKLTKLTKKSTQVVC